MFALYCFLAIIAITLAVCCIILLTSRKPTEPDEVDVAIANEEDDDDGWSDQDVDDFTEYFGEFGDFS
jgi:quinol-cytochrome oxidoreductase complex cytochrome b subunit